MCCLNPFLDLDVFPQISQDWLTLLRWFATMCLLILKSLASFPQTLQMNALNLAIVVMVSIWQCLIQQFVIS